MWNWEDRKKLMLHQLANAWVLGQGEPSQTVTNENFRENHARLVIRRQGDPRFVQRQRRTDGSVRISWTEGTQLDKCLRDALDLQYTAFLEKFGRPPSFADPIFFDPDASEPRSMKPDRLRDELTNAAQEAGVDPAFVHAWRTCGYLVTEENRHTFSAEQVKAFSDAATNYWSKALQLEKRTARETFNPAGREGGEVELADWLRLAVETTITRRDPQIAIRIQAALESVKREAISVEARIDATLSFNLLARWLSESCQSGLPSIEIKGAIAWVHEELGNQAGEAAAAASGLIKPPGRAHYETLEELFKHLGDDLLPAMIWLTCGVVAIVGAGVFW